MTEEINKYTIGTLANSVGVTRPDLIRYCQTYNINLRSFCKKQQGYIGTYLEIYEEGYKILFDRKDEIISFKNDFFKSKKIAEVCKTLSMNLSEFVEFYNVHKQTIYNYGYTLWPEFRPSLKLTLENSVHYISSQLLLHLSTKFPEEISISKTNIEQQTFNKDVFFDNIIGYEDFKSILLDQLNPIVAGKTLDLWGLRPPGGIILFGPPGCGKTFWAQEIAKYLQFQFLELPRSIFASSLVDGAVTKLKDILDAVEPKTVIFFDEFDSIAEERSNTSSGSRENTKVVNTLLQEIPKLIKRDVLILAATNYLTRIDSAVIRPGRFDLKIPIFPPSSKERAEIIFYKLSRDLNSNSPLKEILINNKVDSADFFADYTIKMKLFSNSLLEDFVDTLKRALKKLYDSGIKLNEIKIDEDCINSIIDLTKAKIVKQDLESLANFYLEVNSFIGSAIYEERLEQLKNELSNEYMGKKDPPRPIGFRQPKIE